MSLHHKIDPFLKFVKYNEKIDKLVTKRYFNETTYELIKKITFDLHHLITSINTKNPWECHDFNCENKIYFKSGDHTMTFIRYEDTLINSNDIIQELQIGKIFKLPKDTYLFDQDYSKKEFEKLLKSQIILGYFYHCNVNIKLTKIEELNEFTKNIVKIVIETLDKMSK